MYSLWAIAIVSIISNLAHAQNSQWLDEFQRDLCHNRWMQMDWQSIIRPCRGNLLYGKNTFEDKMRTSSKWSHTSGLHFKKTGEFSKVTIQSRTADGRIKRSGGDTWRLFIRGPENLTPFVSDLNNGVYEAKFMLMEPGFYKAEIVLESTLCEAFKDPPQDWLKRDATTILNDEKNARLLWEPLRGGNISFKIEPSSEAHITGLQRQFHRWKDSCGSQYQCGMLWKGFGRWVNSTWKPYIDETFRLNEDDEAEERCIKEKEGVLKLTGDALTTSLSNYIASGPLCKDIFASCQGPRKGEQPDSLGTDQRDMAPKIAKSFSTKPFTKSLRELLSKPEMDEKSGMLINYGSEFAKSLSFQQYRTFIDRVSRILKEKYKGKAVWRTMPSLWRESANPYDHFGNHQRVLLFNAYATSAMCNAGVPTVDVFQMNEARPYTDDNEVVKEIEKIIATYFREHPSMACARKSKATQSAFVISTGEPLLTDGSSPSRIIAGINAASDRQTTPVASEAAGSLMSQGAPTNVTTDNLVAAMETESDIPTAITNVTSNARRST